MRVVLDQPALEQRGDGAVAGRAADQFDALAGDGLAVGDYRQRRFAQRDGSLSIQVPLDGLGHVRRRHQAELITVLQLAYTEMAVCHQVLAV
jgi:hypothetical protein